VKFPGGERRSTSVVGASGRHMPVNHNQIVPHTCGSRPAACGGAGVSINEYPALWQIKWNFCALIVVQTLMPLAASFVHNHASCIARIGCVCIAPTHHGEAPADAVQYMANVLQRRRLAEHYVCCHTHLAPPGEVQGRVGPRPTTAPEA